MSNQPYTVDNDESRIMREFSSLNHRLSQNIPEEFVKENINNSNIYNRPHKQSFLAVSNENYVYKSDTADVESSNETDDDINYNIKPLKSFKSIDIDSNSSNNSHQSIESIIKSLKEMKHIRLTKLKNNINNNKSEKKNTKYNQLPPRLHQAFKGTNTIISPRINYNNNKFMYNNYTTNNNGNNNINNENNINVKDINECEMEKNTLKMKIAKQEELIKSLQYKLLNNGNSMNHLPSLMENGNTKINEKNGIKGYQLKNKNDSNLTMHIRQKSLSQISQEESTLLNVRKEIRLGLSYINTIENDIERILKTIGDDSSIYVRLNKVYELIKEHNIKLVGIEKSLNINEYDFSENENKNENEIKKNKINVKKLLNSELFTNVPIDKKEFDNLNKECSNMRIKIAQLMEEKKQWKNTKNELNRIKLRNDNLNKLLDKLTDEKLQNSLIIEELEAILSKNGIKYQIK